MTTKTRLLIAALIILIAIVASGELWDEQNTYTLLYSVASLCLACIGFVIMRQGGFKFRYSNYLNHFLALLLFLTAFMLWVLPALGMLDKEVPPVLPTVPQWICGIKQFIWISVAMLFLSSVTKSNDAYCTSSISIAIKSVYVLYSIAVVLDAMYRQDQIAQLNWIDYMDYMDLVLVPYFMYPAVWFIGCLYRYLKNLDQA